MKKTAICVALLMNFFISIQGVSAAEGSDDAKKRSGVIPMAMPYYMPETSFGIGFFVLFYNRPGHGTDEQRPNELSIYGTVTVKNQASIGVSTDRYFRGNDIKISGKIESSRFPDLFWGVGPDTGEGEDEKFTSIRFNTRGSVMFKVMKNFYIGPAYNFMYDYMEKREVGGILNMPGIKGRDGTTISGFGMNINWDRRDNVFYPRRGFYCDFQVFMNREEIGSEYAFSKVEVDLRYFIPVHGDHVLGLQGYGEFSAGSVPFQSMARLGGDVIMRGYYQGRYRDRNYGAVQAEYRFPLYWRLGGVLFGSAAQVADTPGGLFYHQLKTAWGGGVRFIADRAEHINIRLDAGVDREGNLNFYLMIKDAF